MHVRAAAECADALRFARQGRHKHRAAEPTAETQPDKCTASAGSSDTILAVTNGWIVPLSGIMHCETLQIFTKGRTGDASSRGFSGLLGLGLLLGAATFAFAREKGCRKAEILAINDYGAQCGHAHELWRLWVLCETSPAHLWLL